MGNGASVSSTRKEYHVWSQVPNAVNLFMGKALVIGGNYVHDNCTRPERCTLGAFCRHGLYGARHHHLQSATGAARGDVDVHPNVSLCGRNNLFSIQNLSAREFFHLRKCIEYTAGHILKRRLHRGGRFSPKCLTIYPILLFDQDGLGRGTTTVSGNNNVQCYDSLSM